MVPKIDGPAAERIGERREKVAATAGTRRARCDERFTWQR
jgi:hypothetical protein